MPRARKARTSKPARGKKKASRLKVVSGKRKKKSKKKGSPLAFSIFLLLSLAVATAAVIEIRNFINYPTLQQFRNDEQDTILSLFHTGAGRRSAAVFLEHGAKEQPEYITRLYYIDDQGERGSPTERFDELCWSKDGSALVATRVTKESAGPVGIPDILWLYDLTGKMFYRAVDAAIPGQGAEAKQSFLQRYLHERKAGLGPPIVRWFELGQKENYIFSWQATRWNRALRLD